MNSDACERFFISLVLQSREACEIAKGKITPDDIPDPLHRRILSTLYELSSGALWQPETVAERIGLKRGDGEYDTLMGIYSTAFGGGFNFRLGNDSVGADIIDDSITAILERSKKRFALHACSEIIKRCREPGAEVQLIEADLATLQTRLCQGNGRKSWHQRLEEWVDAFHERYEQKDQGPQLATNIPSLDRIITRFVPGELVIISAKRKVGKSAFMIGLVSHSSIKHQVPGLIITLEMGANEWYDRFFAHRAHVDSLKISEARCSRTEFTRITSELQTVQSAPLVIEDTDCFTLPQIESLIRYYYIKQKISYAIIDHAGLIQFPGAKIPNRTDELDKTGMRLKTLAKRLGIVIFLLSHTNDKGVTFGSYMLEAHLTKLIRIEIPDEEDEHTNRRYLNLMLNRQGRTGGVESIFDGSTCTFSEITHRDEPSNNGAYRQRSDA